MEKFLHKSNPNNSIMVDRRILSSLICFYKMTDLKNKIINGDSLEELKKIPDGTFDLVFADPLTTYN